MLNKLWEIFLKVYQSEHAELPTAGLVTFVNPYTALLLANNKEIDVTKIAALYADGHYLATIIGKFFKTNIIRRSFDTTSIALEILSRQDVAIIGATQQELDKFSANLKRHYNIKVLPVSHGFIEFNDENVKDLSQGLSDKTTLVLGLGCPTQEKVALKFLELNPNLLIFTCGAFITQSSRTDDLKYYPDFINRLNLRWLFRLFKEPHTISRLHSVAKISIYALLMKVGYGKK